MLKKKKKLFMTLVETIRCSGFLEDSGDGYRDCTMEFCSRGEKLGSAPNSARKKWEFKITKEQNGEVW